MAEKIVSFLVGKANIIHNGKGYVEGQTIPEMTLAQAKSLAHAKKGTIVGDEHASVEGFNALADAASVPPTTTIADPTFTTEGQINAEHTGRKRGRPSTTDPDA